MAVVAGIFNWGARMLGGGSKVIKPAGKGGGFMKTAGGTAAGVGVGDALFGAPEPIQGPTAAAAGGGRRGGGFGSGGGSGMSSGGTGVSASQATSTLSDVAGRDPVVNQLQDIEKVLVQIKGDTAVMASGFSGTKGPAVESEDSIRNRLGMGGKSNLSATASGGIGALAAMQALGLFDNVGGGEGGADGEGLEAQIDEAMQNLKEGWDDLAGRVAKNVGKVISGVAVFTDSIDNVMKSTFSNLVEGGSKVLGKITGKTPTTPKPSMDVSGKPATSNVIDINTKQPINVDAPKVDTPKAPSNIVDISGNPISSNDAIDVKGKTVDIDGPKIDSLPKPDPDVMSKSFLRNAGEYGLKTIPVVGAGMGIGFSIQRLFEGDFAGSAAELGGVFVPSVAGSLTIDAGLLARDIYNDVYGTDENPRPHDAHAAMAGLGNFPAYTENYGQILDYVTKKLGEMKAQAGEKWDSGVDAVKDFAGGVATGVGDFASDTFEGAKSLVNKFNPFSSDDAVETAGMSPQMTPSNTSGGSVTIGTSTSEASAAEFGRTQDANAAGQQQIAAAVNANTMAATSSSSGNGAVKVEKIGVYKDTTNEMIDRETKLLMQD